MITVRPAADRGHANHGWLDSHHTFSFANYYDPKYMGVSRLRVINDDRVAPGAGFASHGHKDMEILSYILEGAITHRDSMGNEETVPAGEFQLMNAGTGVVHSEYNKGTAPLHFLQIWLRPEQLNLTPGYQQARFADHGKVLVLSPDGADGSLTLHQDTRLYRVRLNAGESVEHAFDGQRVGYLQVITGEWQIDGQRLTSGDGAEVAAGSALTLTATSDAELLLFDLP